MKNKNRVFQFLPLFTLFIFLVLVSSCNSDDDMSEELEDSCSGKEFNGNTMTFNNATYDITDYNYSTVVGIEHNFSIEGFTESCVDSVDIFLKFTKTVSFPDFSLAGQYETVFSSATQTFDQMSGFFDTGAGGRQTLLSGNTAEIVLLNDTTYQILIDAPTGAIGQDNQVMQLDITVPKE